ncbi:galactofuranosyltransferase [Parabacteroides goldsteinii]|uniref:galactofuranosyltransferase n=1 Tax=Parabacteroides goldsteinii TaxID=328812 RepID=UPI0032B2C6E2
MRKFYLSKNYNEINSAGNKAKTDIETILANLGYKNAGLAQTHYSNKVIGFIMTLIGVLKVFFTISKNDCIVLQYPFKKYYTFICHITHAKGGKVITIIHDLGTFRRKKLSAKKEIKRLNNSDYLVAHNCNMKNWLQTKKLKKPIMELEIFDYLSSSKNNKNIKIKTSPIRVIYAGSLGCKKNKFLYKMDHIISEWQFELYGNGFDNNKITNKEHFNYNGFVPSEQLIEDVCAHFGLIWDGDSISICSGNYGEYLKINNPHKVSLYIKCNLPLIIWKEAALASFVTNNQIGICINSLDELDSILPSISAETYDQMRENIKNINKKISSGYYLTKALTEIENNMNKQN